MNRQKDEIREISNFSVPLGLFLSLSLILPSSPSSSLTQPPWGWPPPWLWAFCLASSAPPSWGTCLLTSFQLLCHADTPSDSTVLQAWTSHFFPQLVLGYFHMQICLAQPKVKIGIRLASKNPQPFPTPISFSASSDSQSSTLRTFKVPRG